MFKTFSSCVLHFLYLFLLARRWMENAFKSYRIRFNHICVTKLFILTQNSFLFKYLAKNIFSLQLMSFILCLNTIYFLHFNKGPMMYHVHTIWIQKFSLSISLFCSYSLCERREREGLCYNIFWLQLILLLYFHVSLRKIILVNSSQFCVA